MKQNASKLLFLTFAVHCILEGTSFSLNPFRGISVKLNQNALAIRSGNTIPMKSLTFQQSPLNPLSPLRGSASLDQPQTAAVPFLNIANVLTIARVAAIPFFMLSFVMRKVILIGCAALLCAI